MRKLSGVLIFFLLFNSCKKENSDLIWGRSFGPGNALFIMSAPDSGIISCGEMNGNPYLIKLSKNKNIASDFTSGREGLFSSARDIDSCFIAGGSTDGKMLLTRVGYDGNQVWDTTISPGFNVGITRLNYAGNGTFLALGSAIPSSSESGASGLLFIRFDTAGNILDQKEISENEFTSASNFTTDGLGNIYIALTRRSEGAKSRATVAKFNSDVQKLWETELYNNKSFGAASLGVRSDEAGNVYITGKTEISRDAGTLDNSFLACINGTGEIIWKKYLENSNSGVALIIDKSDMLWMLSRNCFIINKFSIDVADPVNDTDEGIIRMFHVCDSYNTDAFGEDIDLSYDGNILASGSRGGNFFLAVKSSLQ